MKTMRKCKNAKKYCNDIPKEYNRYFEVTRVFGRVDITTSTDRQKGVLWTETTLSLHTRNLL